MAVACMLNRYTLHSLSAANLCKGGLLKVYAITALALAYLENEQLCNQIQSVCLITHHYEVNMCLDISLCEHLQSDLVSYV